MNLNQRQMAVFMEVGPLADKKMGQSVGQGMWHFIYDGTNLIVNKSKGQPVYSSAWFAIFLLRVCCTEAMFF